MLRWLYPKDRDYSFTLWDFFVSLTLVVMYVAGYRLLTRLHDYSITLQRIEEYPGRVETVTDHDTYYEFRSRDPQELVLVLYQLKNRTTQYSTYVREIIPLPAMQPRLTYYSTRFDYEIISAQNCIVINQEKYPLVHDTTAKQAPDLGRFSMASTPLFYDHALLFVYGSAGCGSSNMDLHGSRLSYYSVAVCRRDCLAKVPVEVQVDW